VAEPINVTGGEVGTEAGDDGLDGTFKEESPKTLTLFPSTLSGGRQVFTLVTITGASCLFKQTKARVIGEQECDLETPETEAVKQNLVCNVTGSKLKYGATENTAKFEATFVTELTGAEAGKAFGAYPS
jgi:hypothetical protein